MNKNLRNIFSFFMSCLFIFDLIAKSNFVVMRNKKRELSAKFELNKYLITALSFISLSFISSYKFKKKSFSSPPILTPIDDSNNLNDSSEFLFDSPNQNINFKLLEQIKSTLKEADFYYDFNYRREEKYCTVINAIDSLIDLENITFSESEFEFMTKTKKLKVLNNDQIAIIKSFEEVNSEIKNWMIFLGGHEGIFCKNDLKIKSLEDFLKFKEDQRKFEDLGRCVPAVLPTWDSGSNLGHLSICLYFDKLNSFFKSNKEIFSIIQCNIMLSFLCMCGYWGMGIGRQKKFTILDKKNFENRIKNTNHNLLRISRSLTTLYMFFGEKIYKMFLIFLFQNLNHIPNSLYYFAIVANEIKSFVSEDFGYL
ncbi:MAG: hypothetical protein LBJ32_01740 [Oscillospiraceae bacterium]|jgi:hypothetical protein|nr:hypothetical protein [Oscillospiraceae bacterium]